MQLCLEKLIKAAEYAAAFTWPEGKGVLCFGVRGLCIGTAMEIHL